MAGSDTTSELAEGSNPVHISAETKRRLRAGFAEIDKAAGIPLGPNGEAVSGRGLSQRIAYFNRLISGPDQSVVE
jgi:hypothetical protein